MKRIDLAKPAAQSAMLKRMHNAPSPRLDDREVLAILEKAIPW